MKNILNLIYQALKSWLHQKFIFLQQKLAGELFAIFYLEQSNYSSFKIFLLVKKLSP